MMNKIAVFFLFTVFAVITTNAQALLYKISLEEQIEQSSLIIEGQVVESKSYFSVFDEHIYTINKVHVHRLFKGEYQEYINVITKGGSVDMKREVVKPSLQLRVNVMGVFMLGNNTVELEEFESKYNTYYTYSDLQGFYKYDNYENLAYNPYYNFSGIQTTFYEKIESLTDSNIEYVDFDFPFESAAKDLATMEITGFSEEEIRSGIGQTVTILGSDFGDTQGLVMFRDADDGGASFVEAYDSDIESWSDTSITVKVPSFAGTGNVRIITNDDDISTSSQVLTVLSSELNTEFTAFPEEEFRPKLINSDNEGGYTWTYNSDFAENTDAVLAFERALDTWICTTGISWLIDEDDTDISITSDDGINVISFGSPRDGNIGFGVLAVTSTYYLGCQVGDTITSYVSEIDMIFSDEFDWNFDEGDPDATENDFQGTATHELGHAHNLGHVIAPTNLMHFETGSGEESATRDIDENSREGAILSYDFSKENEDELCGQKIAEDRSCFDDSTLDIESFIFVESPVINDRIFLHIKEVQENLEYNFFLYSMSGRLEYQTVFTSENPTLDIKRLSIGVYIVKVIVGSQIHVQKIVLE